MVTVDVARHTAPVVPALHLDGLPAAAAADVSAVTVCLLDPPGNANTFRGKRDAEPEPNPWARGTELWRELDQGCAMTRIDLARFKTQRRHCESVSGSSAAKLSSRTTSSAR